MGQAQHLMPPPCQMRPPIARDALLPLMHAPVCLGGALGALGLQSLGRRARAPTCVTYGRGPVAWREQERPDQLQFLMANTKATEQAGRNGVGGFFHCCLPVVIGGRWRLILECPSAAR